MSSTNDTGVVAGLASGQTRHRHSFLRLMGGGLVTTLAVLATTLVAALAQMVGVKFKVTDGEETIPLSGIAFVTGNVSVAVRRH